MKGNTGRTSLPASWQTQADEEADVPRVLATHHTLPAMNDKGFETFLEGARSHRLAGSMLAPVGKILQSGLPRTEPPKLPKRPSLVTLISVRGLTTRALDEALPAH